jgi:hypothetical protein
LDLLSTAHIKYLCENAFNSGDGTLLQQDDKGFDFNLRFKHLFFTIVPSELFVVASSWRMIYLVRKRKVVHALTFQYIKCVSKSLIECQICSSSEQGAILTYVCFTLALVVLTAINDVHVLSMLMVAAVLRLVAALLVVPLSAVEHTRNPRPSTLLAVYMCLGLILIAT